MHFKADTEYNARELGVRAAAGHRLKPHATTCATNPDSSRAALAELQPTDPDVAQPRVADEAEQHAKKRGD